MPLTRFAFYVAVTAALLAAATYVLPEAFRAGRLVLHQDAAEEIAAYRLQTVPPAAYESQINAALAADDADLADSLVALADGRHITLPADLRRRVTEAQAFSLTRTLRETWKGIAEGDASSPEGLTGAVLADLSGVGDARDLLHQGEGYIATGDYDPLTIGLAVVGLGATAATIYSLGVASPSRVGVSALKFASRAGEIPPSLRRALITLAKDTVDGPALKKSLGLLGRGEFTAGRDALALSVRAAPLRTLKTMTADLGTVISSRGYRAGRDVLKLAGHPRDFTRLRTLAGRFGKGFRGALMLLGPAALTLAGLTFTLASWLVTGLLWCLAALFFVYRIGRMVWRASLRYRQTGGMPASE